MFGVLLVACPGDAVNDRDREDRDGVVRGGGGDVLAAVGIDLSRCCIRLRDGVLSAVASATALGMCQRRRRRRRPGDGAGNFSAPLEQKPQRLTCCREERFEDRARPRVGDLTANASETQRDWVLWQWAMRT